MVLSVIVCDKRFKFIAHSFLCSCGQAEAIANNGVALKLTSHQFFSVFLCGDFSVSQIVKFADMAAKKWNSFVVICIVDKAVFK